MVATDTPKQALPTLLCLAASTNDLQEMGKLMDAGADPNCLDYEDRSPLHVAAGHGHADAVKLLLERKANPETADKAGQTPLDEGMKSGVQEVIELLGGVGGEHPQAQKQVSSLKNKSREGNWAIKKNDVHVGKLLSETVKSKVYRAEWVGTEVVAKFAKVEQKNDEDRDAITNELLHEIELMAKMRHPDLVLFLGANVQEGDPEIMFISEYMEGGDLQRYYEKKKMQAGGHYVAPVAQVVRWASAVARALNFLHRSENRIIHRDLKPLNLLMNKDHKDVKVADFGIGKMINNYKGDKVSRTMTGGVGTWRYMAPEVVRYQSYDEKVDIFAFGLILYFMSSGREPFHERQAEDWMLKEYLEGNEPRPKSSQCQKAIRDIMERAWHADPTKRPQASEILESLSNVVLENGCAACSIA